MTTEIEKQFFDTFGIEAKTNQVYGVQLDYHIDEYPEITDHILLELICIAHTSPVITFVSRDVEKLKEEVLTVLCHYVNYRDIKNQVQTIFKRCNNHDR